MNSVSVIGRRVADPELQHVPSGTALCKMRLAVDRAGGKQDDGSYSTGFFNVTASGKTAELCGEYLAKGRQVGFSGSLRFEEWTDKETGGKRTAVSITAFDMTFVGSKPDGQTADVDADSDIPF